jgi:photosystem II stability/assembly factor-like uncharacterized protein
MTPEEDELRRALDARSGSPTPEFRARLSSAFDHGRPKANLMPAVALAVVVVLSVTSIGVLMAARNAGRTHGGLASGARVVTPTPIAMPTSAQLVAPSTNVVWVLVDYVGLYRSTDQGAHWELRPMPAEFGVTPWISFIDDHEGWLLAPGSPTTQCQQAQAAIWHTSDAGASWQNLSVGGIAEGQCKEHIWFVDSRRGFISAWDDNHQPTVYFTGDGGRTWTASTLPDPPDFKTLPGGFTLRVDWVKGFDRALYLEASGRQGAGTPYPDVPDRQYIFVSTDGGAAWSWKQKVASRYIVMVSEMRWLQLVVPGQSYESTNGGQQFHQYDSYFNTDTPAGGPQIVFADAQVGYAEGRGSLQRTVDSGAHWVRITTPGTASTPTPAPGAKGGGIPMPSSAAVSAPSAQVVWALVAGQYMFRSDDQGVTWKAQTILGKPVAAISFVDGTHGWALFTGGSATCPQGSTELWRTSDGATTWGQVLPTGIPADQCPYGLWFGDVLHGFIAASDAAGRTILYRTADGGVSWSGVRLPNPSGVFSVKSFGGAVLLSARDANAVNVYRSSDGGATWTFVEATPDRPIFDVSFLTATHWLKVQPGLETTDAGKTWHSFTNDYQGSAVASVFVFVDDKVGYGSVRGQVSRTVDGGAHWVRIKNSWP